MPDLVCVTDELTLDFDHWRNVLLGNYSSELTQEQIARLNARDEELGQRGRRGKKYSPDFWTDEAL